MASRPSGSTCATLADLTAAKEEILAAIAALQPKQGYAAVNGVKYNSLQMAADAVTAGGQIEIYGELKDLNASAVFQRGCSILGIDGAKLTWTLGTTQRMAWGKGLLVLAGTGNSFTVDNIELSGARVTDLNGAGVRVDPGVAMVTIRNCNIHDNENGVLSVAAVQRYEGNTFRNNGNAVGNAHGVYVNAAAEEVIAEGNVFGTAIVGNQFKSRAKKLVFRQNVVAELDGACSWQLDISNGGDALVEKNVFEQGPNAQNRNMISYAPEGLPADGRSNQFFFRDNIVIQDHALGSWGVNVFNQPTVLDIVRNTFVGPFAQVLVNAALDPSNTVHPDRASAGLQPYPNLPAVPV